jgi:hypothetical protein
MGGFLARAYYKVDARFNCSASAVERDIHEEVALLLNNQCIKYTCVYKLYRMNIIIESAAQAKNHAITAAMTLCDRMAYPLL